MQANAYQYLKENPKLAHFVRLNPVWYRYLSRDPDRVQELEKASKQFYGKTLFQQVDKIGNHVQMVNMLINFADVMKD
ncbi:YlbE-like protein [Lentibacillus halodurans]|uniref:YlbE-like protein n=1 Tax=Lentibacillus halodurans TaxID=237679 RepID=A0A1I0YYW4_9BACI|nr:YlbE-like family protein [Lentibacillus halodurans]SFB18619.1 YlbE-like protein [Lentibacillus halodurans]